MVVESDHFGRYGSMYKVCDWWASVLKCFGQFVPPDGALSDPPIGANDGYADDASSVAATERDADGDANMEDDKVALFCTCCFS